MNWSDYCRVDRFYVDWFRSPFFVTYGVITNKYCFARFKTFFQCMDHSSLSSSVTPKYFVCELKSTCFPFIINLLGNCLGLRFFFVNSITTVFSGLKARPFSLPQSTS